jgi:hypothetical protein
VEHERAVLRCQLAQQGRRGIRHGDPAHDGGHGVLDLSADTACSARRARESAALHAVWMGLSAAQKKPIAPSAYDTSRFFVCW